jgi:hypothetical protein
MPDIDFFSFFRWMLALIVGIYASIITLQSIYNWYIWLAGSDKYMSLLRRYLVVHGLRLRVSSFWGDVIVCLLLGIAFVMIWRAQHTMDSIEETVKTTVKHHVQPPGRKA